MAHEPEILTEVSSTKFFILLIISLIIASLVIIGIKKVIPALQGV